MYRGHSPQKMSLSVFTALVGLTQIVGCQQDPAFQEYARNLSDAEISARAAQDGSLDAKVGNEGKTRDSTEADGTPVVDVTIINNSNGAVIDGNGNQIGDNGGNGTGDGSSATGSLGGGAEDWSGPGGNETNGHPGDSVSVSMQTQRAKVDILWVVDNSGSMEWAQSQLANRFTSYADKLQNMNVDFQLGITSTDMCNINWSSGDPVADEYCPSKWDIQQGYTVNGKMVGPLRGELVTDSATNKKFLLPGSSFVNSFVRLAKLGTNGSGVEQGLTAAKSAIQKSSTGVNGGFIRNDAFLSVVVLSDEEDDGIQFWCEDAWGNTSRDMYGNIDTTKCKADGFSPYADRFGMIPYAITNKSNGLPYTNYKFTADNFVSYLSDTTVKGPGKFRVSAITGMKKANSNTIDCSLQNGPLEAGTNYLKAAQLTGGIAANICSSDWSNILADIGQNTVQLSSRIALPAGKFPFPGTLEVYVEGALQADSKYTYNEQGNFIEFVNPLNAGTSVNVKYRETVF